MSQPRNTIVTIDPGSSGGIAVFGKGRATAVKMPKDIQAMQQYFIHIRDTYEHPVVFIEKVQAYIKDDEAPGKKFAINKMLANYERILTVVKMLGFRVVEVYPVSWQSTLGLKFDKKDEITKTERKNHYARYAQNLFPEVKVTLATADALCLVQFALVKIETDMAWIRERIQNDKPQTLL